MEFRQAGTEWIGYREEPDREVICGHIVKAMQDDDLDSFFYFQPVVGILLSCRDCRKIAAKLSELNG